MVEGPSAVRNFELSWSGEAQRVTPRCVTVLPLFYHCVPSDSAHTLPLTPWLALLSFSPFMMELERVKSKSVWWTSQQTGCRAMPLSVKCQMRPPAHAAPGAVWGNKSHMLQSFLKCSTFLSPAFFVFPSLSSDLSTNLTPSYSNTHVCACLPLIRWITLHSSAVGEDEAIGWGVRAVSPRLGVFVKTSSSEQLLSLCPS